MEIKTDLSLQTKQVISQVQMESLNILSMSVIELQEFLQNEEIENPLMEYAVDQQEGEISVVHREYDRFYNGGTRKSTGTGELYQLEDGSRSVEELLYTQFPWKSLGKDKKKVVDFCIQSLEESGYLLIPAEEIAKVLRLPETLVIEVLSDLKRLEPKGIFASGLEECLLLQIRGMENEAVLEQVVRNHLKDVAEGRISNISRKIKLSSMEVRKLIYVIKGLNPIPLNGYGEGRAQYIIPDILLSFEDGQWIMELNDKYMGNVRINEFYVHMMETANDEELKGYFEGKLKRARFIMNALEQRRRTLWRITESILMRQSGYFLGKKALVPMTLEEIADEIKIHKSTVSRAIRGKYLLSPVGCFLLRELFTTGIFSGDDQEVSRITVKEKLKVLLEKEDKRKPFSDEQLAKLLEEEGMPVSRRTVAKYRMEMGIGSTFSRREET